MNNSIDFISDIIPYFKELRHCAIIAEGQTQQLRHSQTTKSGFITIKKDLVEAVRRIAPASIEPSPIIFRDIQMELKTVRRGVLFLEKSPDISVCRPL